LPSGWDTSDAYLKTVVIQWRTAPSSLPTVADVVIEGPWCFTPEMYAERPEFVDTLVEFVRGGPSQPPEGFVAQLDAAVAHDARAVLSEIQVPTLLTFGRRDLVCSTRFAGPLQVGSPAASWSSSIICRTPACTRIPRPSMAPHSTSCCASAPNISRFLSLEREVK
jgi:hypothetical protein